LLHVLKGRRSQSGITGFSRRAQRRALSLDAPMRSDTPLSPTPNQAPSPPPPPPPPPPPSPMPRSNPSTRHLRRRRRRRSFQRQRIPRAKPSPGLFSAYTQALHGRGLSEEDIRVLDKIIPDLLFDLRSAGEGMYRQRIQKAWGHTAHRGWARLLLNRARDLIIHDPAHHRANGAAMPTDEGDQDGHFFLGRTGLLEQ